MTVKELIKILSNQDQNATVFMETRLFLDNTRIVVSSHIARVGGTAGGSLDRLDNQFYGVTLRSRD